MSHLVLAVLLLHECLRKEVFSLASFSIISCILLPHSQDKALNGIRKVILMIQHRKIVCSLNL